MILPAMTLRITVKSAQLPARVAMTTAPPLLAGAAMATMTGLSAGATGDNEKCWRGGGAENAEDKLTPGANKARENQLPRRGQAPGLNNNPRAPAPPKCGPGDPCRCGAHPRLDD